ncbi:LOW QUALITY PROTEIN: T-cell surface glycoprotein CD8 alpha chain [Anabas testudineus]|uniref:LOW QUALITY PROTEIN: T-cell surface glycoprotein CD8 alpha chain n=1 Tax=Anabas testudineus TaxID=64144 RepID=UPI000E462319|nr:LOW QUALITY PROTEIN: T-cell surface glycoprotein CD8 alpha chain [Anabas testudineus]
MDQKWIQILLILMFYQKITSGAVEKRVNEGEEIEIFCNPPEKGSIVTWFRVLEKSRIQFIASFSNTGMDKSSGPLDPSFSYSKIRDQKLILKNFKKHEDSGVYSCASLKSNELKFGEVTRLVGAPDAVTEPAPRATSAKPKLFTARPCVCNNQSAGGGDVNPRLHCSLLMLAPLAGACGLLLLLLIITILYCNKMRTRRCPHHYKKRPRTTAPEKHMMTNRHI